MQIHKPFIAAIIVVALSPLVTTSAAVFDSLGSSFNTDPTTADDMSKPGATYQPLSVAYKFQAESGSGLDYTVQGALFSKDAAKPIQVVFNLWSDSAGGDAAVDTSLPGGDLVISRGIGAQTTSGTPSMANVLVDTLHLSSPMVAGKWYWFGATVVSPNDSTYVGTFYLNNLGKANWVAYYDTPSSPGAWARVNNDLGNPTQAPLGAFSITAVPEPNEYAKMAALGLLAFAGYRRWMA